MTRSLLAASSLALVAALGGTAVAGTADDQLDVLVFGNHESRAALVAQLEAQHARPVVASALPADLSKFDVVWHLGAYTALSAAETNHLYEFLATGGGVLLTGERPCCENLNQSLQRLVDATVVTPGVRVGGLGDAGAGLHAFNTEAVGGVTRFPARLASWKPAAAGVLGGVEPRSVLATDAAGRVTAAAWSGEQLVTGGQLVILMDADWNAVDLDATILVGNLVQFLDAPVGLCGDGYMHGAEQCDDGNLADGDSCSATCTEEQPQLDPQTPDTNPAGAVDDPIDTDGVVVDDGADAEDPELTAGCAAGGGDAPGAGLLLLAAVALAGRRRRA